MFLIPILFSILCLFRTTISETECPIVVTHDDRRTNSSALRLVQYNVEWLFMDYYSAADCPGNGCAWHNASAAQTHLNYVSNVVKQLNPDILNLCEIEGCDEVKDIIASLEDLSYAAYLKKGTDTATGQNVGLITRIDPKSATLYRTENKATFPVPYSTCGYTGSPSTTGVSKHYITEYEINKIPIALIGAHLIAIPTDPIRCAQREGQAQVLQEVIYNYIKNGYEIIMMGDFNDFDKEVMDMNGNKPLSSVLDILKGYVGTYANKYELTSAASLISQSQRYSDWYDSDNNCNTASQKDYSMIDHILVSSKIKQNIVNAYIYHGYNEYCGKWNSDHFPVVVDFVF